MECNNDFRHVCFKDLQNYIERDKYFSDFTEEEIKLIQLNLGIKTSENPDSSYSPTIVLGTYDEIYDLKTNGLLKLGYLYVITDFKSVYLDKQGNVLGLNKVPSNTYYVILTPTSTSSFDARVCLNSRKGNDYTALSWIVEYDITPITFLDGTTTRGKITYLKDNNGNYAYYDFKNIKFLLTLDELNKGANTYTEDLYFYTFDIDGNDASNSICKNNHLEKDAYRNVFLGNTQNVSLTADVHDNVFFKSCEACTFKYGTHSNYFKDNVTLCSGTVDSKELGSITALNTPKEFITVADKLLLRYLDTETLAMQLVEI